MVTKSNADYKAAERARKYARGYVPIQVWLHALDAPALKAYAAKLDKARAKTLAAAAK